MQELIFKIIYMVLYVTAAIGRAPYAIKTKKLKVKVRKRKLVETFILLFTVPMMILPLFYVFSDWIDYFNITLPIWVRVIGIIGFSFAVFVHNWTHIALGANWSPTLEIKKNQKLITKGPYKYVRHPMYTSTLFWAVFQGLFLSNWLIIISGLLCFSAIYFLRVKYEEQLMIEEFGKEYKDYMKRTGRIFPKF